MMSEEARAAAEMLKEYQHYKRRIAELKERIAILESQATSATYKMSQINVHSSRAGSKPECAAISIADIEAQLQTEVDTMLSKRVVIQNTINCMTNELYKRMLELKYIDGRKWAAVNCRLHISRQHSTRIHIKALEQFYACLKR